MNLDVTITRTPLGPMALFADGDALIGLALDGSHGADCGVVRHLARHRGPVTLREHPDAAGAAARLTRYFGGDLAALDEQPLRLVGTPFQCDVWNALRRIPAGQTWTYAQLAQEVGRPSAVRAVGAANGANPIALFVPCHRVIGADGTLWGYGGGLPMKARLLELEGAVFHASAQEQLSLNP